MARTFRLAHQFKRAGTSNAVRSDPETITRRTRGRRRMRNGSPLATAKE
jgi:hypothetical protein